MAEEIQFVRNKVFTRMYANPKLRDILRRSRLNNRPIAELDFKYDKSKGG